MSALTIMVSILIIVWNANSQIEENFSQEAEASTNVQGTMAPIT